MTRGHPIERALDLVRMPTLARTVVAPPIPPGVAELMQIAAAARKPCEEAAAATGQPVEAVIEAARFYLQQLLFRADADCYRILGLSPAPRARPRAATCAGCCNGCIRTATAVWTPSMPSGF